MTLDDPASQRRILTPSQLNALARSLLEDSFPLVEIVGEISNLARPASGHIYLSLKDRHAQIRCALFKPKSQWLRFKPADGQQVLARGRLTLYEPRGDYQLVLEHMEPAGEGALQRAFEALKLKLREEGLFDSERKQPLPAHLYRLAVITSPSGAAVHDVLTVLRKRFPLLPVDLLPVPVQGQDAPARIIDMLLRADRSARYDALLLTRGGGSLEDLQAFNDEALARAIAQCRTPVISAVGHEVDFTIADFVADLRCATPSAAAETLSPDAATLQVRLQRLQDSLRHSQRRQLQGCAQHLDRLLNRLQTQRPLARLQRDAQRAQALHLRIQRAVSQRMRSTRQRQQVTAQRLRAANPARRLQSAAELLQRLRIVLQGSTTRHLQSSTRALAHLGRTLHAMSPLATVDRGYAILRAGDVLVRSIDQVDLGQSIEAQLKDGRLQMTVTAQIRTVNDEPSGTTSSN